MLRAILGTMLVVATSLMLPGITPVQAWAPAPQQASPRRLVTNLRGFGIPFQINAQDDSFIEVQLYLSRDGGRNWTFQGRQATDQQEFPFQAQADGDYWFSLKTLDRDRRLLPEGQTRPELHVVVDTIRPRLDFRVQTDAAGRVVCRWQAEDPHLDPASLKILYQAQTDSGLWLDWVRVPVELAGVARQGVYADQLAWWPDTQSPVIRVALEIADEAGNTVRGDRQLNLPRAAWRAAAVATARPNPRGPLTPPPQPEWAQPGWQSSANGDSAAAPVCQDGVCQVPPAGPARPVAAQRLATRGNLPAEWVGSPEEYVDPPIPPGYVPEPASQPAPASAPSTATQDPPSIAWPSQPEDDSGQQRVTSTTRGPDPNLAPAPAKSENSSGVTGPVTPVPSNPSQMTVEGDQVIGESTTQFPRNQFRLRPSTSPLEPPTLMPRLPQSTEAGEAGSPGAPLAVPALPVSQPVPVEEPARSVVESSSGPPPGTRAAEQVIGSKRFRLNYGIEAIDPSGVGRVQLWVTRDEGQTWQAWGHDPDRQSPFPVEVQEEGRYGFRIVVQSRDGLTGEGPVSGDDADMWIVVDTEAPLARITAVPYGRGPEAGRLAIEYSVSDPLLTLRPISLSWSATAQGPWQAIETGLRNEGRYLWKPQRQMPDRIHLRLEAVDRAGNVGVHQLEQPIDISGLVPRGTIHGVTPVGG